MWLVRFGIIDPNGLLAGQQVKRAQMMKGKDGRTASG